MSQEVWLIAIESFDRFDRRRGTFRDWLLGIARHRALRASPRRARRDSAMTAPIGRPTPSPRRSCWKQVERADVVRAALLCLDDDRRRVLLDKYVAGLSVAEIAARIQAVGQGRRIPALAGPRPAPGPVATLFLDPDGRPTP